MARGMRLTGAVAVLALCMSSAPGTPSALVAPVSGPECSTTVTQLVNSGFEIPTVGSGNPTFAIRPASEVTGWGTTEADQRIEIWSHGFQGVVSDGGVQHVELNANDPSTLFQSVSTVPGTRIVWRLSHRGRNGIDVMRVVIGPPGGPFVEQSPDVSDGQTWGRHTGEYIVPPGQDITLFGFEAVSSAGGNLTQGNFLDEIYFGTAPCLVVDKHVYDSSDNVIDNTIVPAGAIVTYRGTVQNQGGLPADAGAIVDQIPPGLVYVPNSLFVEEGPNPGPRTDAIDGDGGDVDPLDRTVHFVVGEHLLSSPDPQLVPRQTVTFRFQAVVDPSVSGTMVSNTFHVAYTSPYTDSVLGVDSDPVRFAVAGADIAVTKSMSPTVVEPGGSATATIVVTNNGPSVASGVTMTDQLAAGETALSVPAGCTSAGSTVTCAVPDLQPGASLTFAVQVVIGGGVAIGTTLVDTASASGPQFDRDTTSNSATASVSVVAPSTSTTVAGPTTTADATTVPSGDVLPATGHSVGVPTLLAAMWVVLGAALILVTRRRGPRRA